VLRYQRGLFLPVPAKGSLEQIAQDQADDELFLTLLEQFEQQGRNVSDKPKSNNYAPTAFAIDPRANKTPKSRFAAAMNRLFAANEIHVATYGRPARPCFKIARGLKSDGP